MLALLNSLTPDNVGLVYLLHGEERFFIDQMIAKLKEIVVTGPMSDFNFQRLKAEKVSGTDIATLAKEIPMMAAKRLLVVDNGHKLKADDLDVLDQYFQDPAPETCLVIVGDRFDLRRKAFSRAKKRSQLYKAEPLKERDIVPFLKARAKARGVHFTQGALSALSAQGGLDCAALDDAVERLGLYAGEGNEVKEEDVSEVITTVREHSIFELVDAIGNRSAQNALTLLKGLLLSREEPIKINFMVARHVRQLLQTRVYIHLGNGPKDLPRLLGVPPFVANKLNAQARRFRGKQLEGFLSRLARTDFELKSSKRSSSLVVQEAVLDLSLSPNP